jgi:hypothetical protein
VYTNKHKRQRRNKDMARRTLGNDVKEGILKDLAAGLSPATLAGKYGVSVVTIYNYRNRNVVAAVTPAAEQLETVTTLPVAQKATKRTVR